MITYPKRQEVCVLVEDQVHMAQAVQSAMRTAFPECVVHWFPNLREAQLWLTEWSVLPLRGKLKLSVVDLGLPDGSGVEFIRKVAELSPETMSLVVTIYGEDSFLFEALRAGATGYILKGEGMAHIAAALQKAVAQEPPISPSIARRLLSHFRDIQSQANAEVSLSTRQRETLALLVRGLSISEAAQALGLKPNTIAAYVKVIYQKLQVSNRAQAAREAIRLKLV
ncbi:MAG: response regulator transcription factor [Proteobacteria bacterium]|nr:MAG: response regulator transcription factor [Pseudomonadota bacterium]